MSEKKYFQEGDIVRVRQGIRHRPLMVVEKVVKVPTTREDSSRKVQGIRCFWFDTNGVIQRYMFNFKDLELHDQ